jgi:hypothetical protein
MNLIQPSIYLASDVLSQVADYMGAAAPSDSNLRTSVNMAISSLGNKLHVHYFAPITYTADTPVYDVSDLYVGREAVPQIQRYGTGSYETLGWWDILDGKLRIRPDTHGTGRIVSMASAPTIPITDYVLAEHLDDGATEIWLQGRINLLPLAGWISVGGDVWFYRGWQHRNAPARTFPDFVAAALGEGEIDPTTLTPVYNMAAGTYTKLLNASRWPYNFISQVHNPGAIVQPCIAFTSENLLSALVISSAINAYRAKIHACAAPEDKALYSSMMANAQSEYKDLYKRVRPEQFRSQQRRNRWAYVGTSLDQTEAP